MNITIRAVGMDMTDAIRQYIEDKFPTLEKYTREIEFIDISVGKEAAHHHKGEVFLCSATVQIPGDVLKIEREEADLYKAIDKVKDHLRETLAQHKERRVDEHKDGPAKD